MAKKKTCDFTLNLWETLSSSLVHFVEGIFFKLGVIVGTHPWKIIVFTWIFVLGSCLGFLQFYMEKNPMKLWVPPDSDFVRDTDWYIETFGSGVRYQKVLITAEDVLQPQVLETISEITNKVNSLSVTHENKNYSLKDLCMKVPVVNYYGSQNNSDDFVDLTLWFDYSSYCSFLKDFTYVCYQKNIVDIWKNELSTIKSLNKHSIITEVNKSKINPVTGHPMDFMKLLGGVEYDEHGDVVTAKSVLLTWMMDVNMSNIDINAVGNLIGTEDWVSFQLAKWESSFLDLMKNISQESQGIKIYYEAGRSFGDISGESMFQELDKLFIGIFVMFFYIQLILSRGNWLEVRLTLGSVGLMCVGMAYVTSVSWCSIFGVPFGPVHSSLPFLLMGLGVDDMFVMKACWEQLTVDELKKSLPHKIGLLLKHAGVSIVITSFTDIVALLIGAITILPSLKSFCIYAAAGVFFIFCFSVTYYVAIFTLDVRRIEANRNGFLFCYKHKTPVRLSQKQTVFQNIFSKFYEKVVFTVPARVLIIIMTIVMTGFSIEAIFRLEQRFDPQWFIPDDTYYKDYLNNHLQYYPEDGNTAMIFMGSMDYHEEFPQLHSLVEQLTNKSYVKNMDTWVKYFHGYMLQNYNTDLRVSNVTEADFKHYLSKFLFSPIGGRFQASFKFSKPLQCGKPVSFIKGSLMQFEFPRFKGPDEYLPAMNEVKSITRNANITTGDGYRSVWSKLFANWVTDEVIAVEVERNVELALLCVMVCTVILITNFQMCLWIFLCVLLTIVNVLGCMQRWGMTVDIVCCIGLELAIGLCVDYAAHVGHTFLTISEGTRKERAFKTVTSIGTAVLFGGGSTLLSLSLLSMSKAYTFKSFFKIFLLVIIFGLFNGLMFLPSVLSLIGPSAYKSKSIDKESPFEIEELNNKRNLEKDNGDIN